MDLLNDLPQSRVTDCVRRERRMTCGAELRQAMGDRSPIPFSESPLFDRLLRGIQARRTFSDNRIDAIWLVRWR